MAFERELTPEEVKEALDNPLPVPLDTVGRELVQLPAPFAVKVEWKQHYFTIALAFLFAVAVTAGFLAPQYVKAGTKTVTVTKTVQSGQDIGTVVAEVDAGCAGPAKMWSKKTAPAAGDTVFLECVLPEGAA